MFTGGPLLSVRKPKHSARSNPGNVAQSFLDKPPGSPGIGPGISGYPPTNGCKRFQDNIYTCSTNTAVVACTLPTIAQCSP